MIKDKLLFEEEGLRKALASIIRRNSTKWLRIGRKILKNRDDAEEVLNEAVRRMLKRNPAFTSREHMRMYIGRAVNNTALELYKRRKRERRKSAAVHSFIKNSMIESDEAFRPDFIMEEEERYAEHEDRLIMLRRGLEELPERQYEAIRLTVLGNCGGTLRDAESASGIPRATIRYRYLQGLKTLRKYMAREQKKRNSRLTVVK